MDLSFDLPYNAVRTTPQYFFLKNKFCDLVLSVKDANQNIGTTLEVQKKQLPQHDCHQHWFLEKADEGQLYIFSRLNCLVMDVRNNDEKCETPVIMYYRKSCPHSLANQKWRIKEGGYIESVMNDQVLEITPGAAAGPGKPVVMFVRRAPPRTAGQQWDFEPVATAHGKAVLESGSSESGSAESEDGKEKSSRLSANAN